MPAHLLLPVRSTTLLVETPCPECCGTGCNQCRYGGRQSRAPVALQSVTRV